MGSSSSSSSSSGSSGKGSGVYQRRVVFDPDADKSEGKLYYVSDEELKSRMLELIENETIMNITIYKHKLYDWQSTQALLYHCFVILETNYWWWSVEKNSEGVFVQRSKKWTYVVDYLERRRRNHPIYKVISDTSRMTLRDFVHMLYFSDAVGSGYNSLTNNCKHFAKTVFDKAAAHRFWT